MKYRSKETEIMDDFSMDGEELKTSLDKIAWINRVLGGNNSVLDAVKSIAKKAPGRIISIADIGCGNGDMLRAVADMGRKENLHFRLHGIDANECTIQYGKELSAAYPEISYSCSNILHPDFEMDNYDIVLFTLTLHHFSDEEIISLINKTKANVKLAIIINDLERSNLSYLLFTWLSSITGLGNMNKNDGKISIKRGFKRKELKLFSEKLKLESYTIQWKWAFRYQWIINKL
ncbi:methyltransferase domain-containing protein [Taibaiella lutea]|nr:methyltransferase domain-containing protein [Taibaiella lutea]